MGHANVTNISKFFIKELRAKKAVSIADCVKAMVKAGETVHASEGEYEEEYMLEMALSHVVHYLSRTNPKAHGYSGPGREGGGPWIEPVLGPGDVPKPNKLGWSAYLKKAKVYELAYTAWDNADDEYFEDEKLQDDFVRIRWRLTPAFLHQPDGVPVLTNITN